MSMLGEQIKELREAARNIQGNLGRCLYRRKDVDEMQQVSGMLFEAADTIEGLRDRMQEEGDALRDYRASQIAAEAERRLQESYGQVPEQGERENGGERESYSRWYELFGTPERAARTLENGTPMCDWCDTQACAKRGGECSLFDYDALLEWLKGASDGE